MEASAGYEVLATGLRFPEGPVALGDGSVLVGEIAAGRLTRVDPDGGTEVVARTGGGPNGAAIGPDGRCYVCNNGGMRFTEIRGRLLPDVSRVDAPNGWLEAVDLASGEIEVLYTSCGDLPLRAPNDLVFDAHGGIWFTDHGKNRHDSRDRGAVYYARADGSEIRQAVHHLDGPNGIGLSPDGTRLYVAETHTGRLWEFELAGPGEIARIEGPAPWTRGRLLANPPGYHLFDSLAVDAAGNISVASIPGTIQTISPAGELLDAVSFADRLTTNVCFGGPDRATAYVTLSSSGQLITLAWPRAGLRLAHER